MSQTYIQIGKSYKNGRTMTGEEVYREIRRLVPDSEILRNNTRLDGKRIYIKANDAYDGVDFAKHLINNEIRKSNKASEKIHSRSVSYSYLLTYENVTLDLTIKNEKLGYF